MTRVESKALAPLSLSTVVSRVSPPSNDSNWTRATHPPNSPVPYPELRETADVSPRLAVSLFVMTRAELLTSRSLAGPSQGAASVVCYAHTGRRSCPRHTVRLLGGPSWELVA